MPFKMKSLSCDPAKVKGFSERPRRLATWIHL
jgi:hypothetical protein